MGPGMRGEGREERGGDGREERRGKEIGGKGGERK